MRRVYKDPSDSMSSDLCRLVYCVINTTTKCDGTLPPRTLWANWANDIKRMAILEFNTYRGEEPESSARESMLPESEQDFEWSYLRERATQRLAFVASTLGLDLANRVVVERDDDETRAAVRKEGYDNLDIGDLFCIPPLKRGGGRK